MAGNDLGGLLGGLLGGAGGTGGAGGGQGGAAGGNILGALLGALSGGGRTGTAGAGADSAAGGNPLGGLLDLLTRSGLVDQTRSWVGTGQNEAVTGAQVKEALPDATLQKIADQEGVTPDQAANHLADVLPEAVDRLTPAGEVPSGSLEDIIRRQNL